MYTNGQKKGYTVYILKINENATFLFLISFQHRLANQNFIFIRQLYFRYFINNVFFVLIVKMHCLQELNGK